MNNSLSDFNLNKKSPLRVVIGTPSIDGKLESHYVESLVETIRECKRHNVEIFPIFLAGESILHMARNKLIKIFYESSSQILVFIDSDQMWSPKVFLDVIKSKKSVLAVPVPLKTDIPKFNVGFDLNEKFDEKTWWVEWGGWNSSICETYKEAENEWLLKLIETVKESI